MAILYDAELSPTKPELLAAWLPKQSWVVEGDRTGEFEVLGAYRFDDPHGEVGLETHLVRGASGNIYQVPLSYRGAPLPDAASYLVTEMEHSQLGHRWVYDAAADPVYAPQLATAILTGGTQVEQFLAGESAPLAPTIEVRGSGEATRPPHVTLVDLDTDDTVTTIRTDALALQLRRVVGDLSDQHLRLDAVAGLDETPRTLATVLSV